MLLIINLSHDMTWQNQQSDCAPSEDSDQPLIRVFAVRSVGKAKKYKCVFQVSALKKIGMIGRHNILFCQNILYRNCIFQYIFPIFQQIWQHFAQIHNKMFRVGAKP